MTEPEHAALDHIRRVVDSVIGEAAPGQEAAAAPTVREGVYCLPVPYLSQAEAGNDSGAAAGTMLAQAYGHNSLTAGEFLKMVGDREQAPISMTQVANALRGNGIPVEMRTNLKLSDLVLILFSGRPAIVLVKQNVLQQEGLTSESFEGPHHLVCLGLDLRSVVVHDPLHQNGSGQAQPIPWLTFYRAWTRAPGFERAALVPHMQLIRRVRIGTATLDVYQQPADESSPVGAVQGGEVFEVSEQRDGWGKIGPDRWIDLSQVADL